MMRVSRAQGEMRARTTVSAPTARRSGAFSRGAGSGSADMAITLPVRPGPTRFARRSRGGQLEAQPRSHGTVIRRCLGEHLAAEGLDSAAHEDVVDLTVRTVRGIGAAAHGALPTAHEQTDGR